MTISLLFWWNFKCFETYWGIAKLFICTLFHYLVIELFLVKISHVGKKISVRVIFVIVAFSKRLDKAWVVCFVSIGNYTRTKYARDACVFLTIEDHFNNTILLFIPINHRFTTLISRKSNATKWPISCSAKPRVMRNSRKGAKNNNLYHWKNCKHQEYLNESFYKLEKVLKSWTVVHVGITD